LHRVMEIFRIGNVGPGVRKSLNEEDKKLCRAHRDCDDQQEL